MRSLLVGCLLSMGCADDTDTCVDQSDCAEGEVCIAFDDDPSDNVIYQPTCAKVCTADGDCASDCCPDGICAPARVCR